MKRKKVGQVYMSAACNKLLQIELVVLNSQNSFTPKIQTLYLEHKHIKSSIWIPWFFPCGYSFNVQRWAPIQITWLLVCLHLLERKNTFFLSIPWNNIIKFVKMPSYLSYSTLLNDTYRRSCWKNKTSCKYIATIMD